jgi:hypothetical protein
MIGLERLHLVGFDTRSDVVVWYSDVVRWDSVLFCTGVSGGGEDKYQCDSVVGRSGSMRRFAIFQPAILPHVGTAGTAERNTGVDGYSGIVLILWSLASPPVHRQLQHRGLRCLQYCVVIGVKYDKFSCGNGPDSDSPEKRWYFGRWPVHGQFQQRGVGIFETAL